MTDQKHEPAAYRWRFDLDQTWSHGDRRPSNMRFGDPDFIEPLYSASTIEALTAQLDALKEENERLREALGNMMGCYDTPLSRRRFPPDDFMREAILIARAALTQPPLPESGESVEGGEWKFWNEGDTEMVFEIPGKVVVSIQPEGVAYTFKERP